MKLITCCSFKGGAGKTTALMALCSALTANGKMVAVLEADVNRPFYNWRKNAVENGTWDERCSVFAAENLPLLETAYEDAESRGFDYALADMHGGSSELNNTVIASSDFLLVPTMLAPLDIDEALSTYRYIVELLVAENLHAQTAILQQRVPVSRATTSQRAASDTISVLPQVTVPMYDRDAFAAMKRRGMLHLTHSGMKSNPAMRLTARNYETVMDEIGRLGTFVTAALEN